ncbi:SLC13 family permease [Bacillus sp. RAR_GA_16]|uniref:SLC13 family permease n=1 Tax=Bacillus sp. RAR_GA_16 TaxID=2876774 RepID=UPI001CC8F3C4|nr:SLC13 family permease [Bacillus sp. RAR_GA_16]
MTAFYIVIITMVAMLIGLFFELGRPEMILGSVLVLFLLTGIITPEEATVGFSNEGMLTIALLFIIAGSIQRSGIIDRTFQRLLKGTQSTKKRLSKLLIPIAMISAFVNNTPIVIASTPMVKKWCMENGVSPSKFLIPLSYATILGGTITLIGTSTNLVVHGLLVENGYAGFSFFQLSVIGIPITCLGLLYLVIFSRHLLPERHPSHLSEPDLKEYTGEALITAQFPYMDLTVKEAQLRSLKGLFLVSILRNERVIAPVSGSTILKEGDRLVFCGDISTITELQRMKGLELQESSGSSFPAHHRLVEAIVTHHSSHLFKKVKDSNFRSHHQAAVIAVHRHNQRLQTKIGEIVLKPGDVLLMVAGEAFDKKNDFYAITPIDHKLLNIRDIRMGWLSIIWFGMMIALVTFNVLSMLTAMAVTTLLLFLTKLVTPGEARDLIQWNVLLMIACSFGIGTALLNSGVAASMAHFLITITHPFGLLATLLSLYLLTNIFTEMMTNSAAAVFMFPVAMEVARTLEVELLPLAITVAIAASASFMTPIGYQTNLIVYGAGGYRFHDFLKIGFPLTVIVMVTTLVIVRFYLMP